MKTKSLEKGYKNIVEKAGGRDMEKAIIYLRTSTKDQHPELQRRDCVSFCTERSLDVVEIVSEQGSAYKLERIRPKWKAVVSRAKKENLNIVLWKYDRSFRNRKEFYKFMKVMFEVYNKKVYSVTEKSILSFWNMIEKSHTENPVFNEFLKNIFKAIWDLMIQQAGEQAEDESKKKSDRVKLAVRKDGGVTRSYKGKRWGRKALKIDDKIITAHKEGKTIKIITEEVYYWDKNKHKKFVSAGYVHKVIKQYKEIHKLSVENKPKLPANQPAETNGDKLNN
jgi:DNA invertase Pin-like site-specific DNA recombinase